MFEIAKKVKCIVCAKMINKEEGEPVKKRYCCKGECYETILKEQNKKDTNKDDWSELYHYIIEIYGHKPTGMMFKQLGDFRKDPYNYTNKGMYLTLKYFHETKGNIALKNSGLGIIPYIYEEAKQNYIKQMEIDEYNSEYESKEKIEVVKINRRKNQNKQQLIGSVINFDDIDEELEDDDDQ